MTEKELQNSILEYLAVRGIPAQRVNTGAASYGRGSQRRFVRYGLPGTADIIGVIPPAGRALFIECKSNKGLLSPQQSDWLARQATAGALTIVARSLDDVRDALE